MTQYSGLKTQLKAEGIYTPAEYKRVKSERGWLTVKHGQSKPSKYAKDNRKEAQHQPCQSTAE